eukprot:scaffold9369_cov182-Amphora_coffeaeformis.AAC.13
MASLWIRIISISDVYELINFPSLATLAKEHKQDKDGAEPGAFLFFLAGDFVGPSLLSSLDKAASMVDCMNAVGITHVCFGNHETDIPMSALAKRVQQSNFVWLNTNLQELNTKLGIDTPEYEILTVISRDKTVTKRIALLGLLTDDSSLYRPGSFDNATIEPVISTTDRFVEELQPKVDMMIPLTHQSIDEDLVFAKAFGGEVFPIILGGHDHVPIDETVRGSRIYKVGMDGDNAGMIDIRWKGNDPAEIPSVEATLLRTNEYPPDLDVSARVASHKSLLKELDQARLFRVGNWMNDRMKQCLSCESLVFSTVDNRLGPSTGSTALATMLRMGMRCHCAIINAGSVRANKEYANDSFFTWSDLKAEIPFPTHMTACYLPGYVLEATITNSRLSSWKTPPIARGGYIHCCCNIAYSNLTRKIESIQDGPFDPDRLYLVALPDQFFTGIDDHVPLLTWAETQESLKQEAAVPAKLLIVQVFSTLLWLQLGSFADLDQDQDGQITREDISNRCHAIFGPQIADLVVDNVLSVADLDGDGSIRPLEMMVAHYSATDLLNHVSNDEEDGALRATVLQVTGYEANDPKVDKLVERVRKLLDTSRDGSFQRDEIRQAVGSIKRQSLLC